MNPVQYRIARPTNNLAKLTWFYTEGLGFKIIGNFTAHQGYDGVMIGLPGSIHHLEFTEHSSHAAIPEPTKENLLVLYFDTVENYQQANNRLLNLGISPVEPENPYWIGKSVTYVDTDKLRIVLFNGTLEPYA